MSYPTVRIQPGRDKRLRGGSPWIYSNELVIDEAAKGLEPGALVRLVSANNKTMGVAHLNARSLIAARLLTRNKDAVVDEAFLRHRIERALALRERIYDRPFYRLVHAEGDGLPGLVVDRYGSVLVVQTNTAGMQSMQALVMGVLEQCLQPEAIIARNDSPARTLEGLPAERGVLKGGTIDSTHVDEGGLTFEINLQESQKTGWYFDQRENRQFVRSLAKDLSVLDLYSYAGGFALNAIAGGARNAVAVDSSSGALAIATRSAELQGVGDRLETRRSDVFKEADALSGQKRRFDLVIADPPPFVRSRKDLAAGLKGYRKLSRMAAALVSEPGFLAVGCCSHNVSMEAFRDEVRAGTRAAGRGGRIIHSSGAGPDHPIHPCLPETAYLKFLVMALD